MINPHWLRIRGLSAATYSTGDRRDRRRRAELDLPRPESLEDRTLLSSTPLVSTQPPTALAAASATLNGTVNPNGTTASAAFEYSTNRYFAPNVVSTLSPTLSGGGAASFSGPMGIAVDPANGNIYLADTGHNAIDMITPGGTVTTIDSTGLSGPTGLAFDTANGNLYVADTGNNQILAIATASGNTVSTVDSTGLNGPTGLAVDSATGNLYVSLTGNSQIQMIATASGNTVTTIAAGSAGLSAPKGLAFDPTNGNLYVADTGNDVIRVISTTNGNALSTLAGTSGTASNTDGTGTAAQFNAPAGIVVDPTTGFLFVADSGNHTIRLITPGGSVSTLAGTVSGTTGTSGSADGVGGAASFNNPASLVMNPTTGAIYVADAGNNAIRAMTMPQIAAQSGLTGTSNQPVSANITNLTPSTTYYYRAVATTTPSTGVTNGNVVSFTTPSTTAPVVVTQAASNVGSTSATLNGTVNPNNSTAAGAFEYSTNPYLAPNVASTYAGTPGTTGTPTSGGNVSSALLNGAQGVVADPANGDVFIADTGNNAVYMVTPAGTITTIDSTGLSGPKGIAVDPTNGMVYVASTGSNDIIAINTSSGNTATTLVSSTAGLSGPTGIAVDPTTHNIYVADSGNDVIRMVTPAGVISTLAGTSGTAGNADGTGTAAKFSNPTGLAVDPNTGNAYVADTGNNTIRMVTPGGVVTTFAGSGTPAPFSGPTGVTVDPTTGFVFVSDTGNNKIQMITPDGTVSALAGSGTAGSTDSTGTGAEFNAPASLSMDYNTDTIYVADTGNSTIRALSLANVAAQSGLTGSTAQSVNAQATGLLPNTKYYYRAVATTTPSTGVHNGDILSFTTTSTTTTAPTATTQAASSIAGTTATLNGVVNPQGAATTAEFVYGTDSTLTSNTTTVPIPALTIGSGTTDVPVIEPVTGLSPNTKYYFRIVATNASGTTDGSILNFTTTSQTSTTPTITSNPATNVTGTTATVSASVNPNGAATTVHFVYGTAPNLSGTTLTTADQSIGSGTTATTVTAALTGLQPGTTYYYQAVATSGGVATPGPIQSLTTTGAAGPMITNLQRYGYHTQPTEFVLTFNSALNPTSAQNVANYTIVSMSGSNSGQTIPVASAVYNTANHTVTLHTVDRVYLYGQYQLTVNGTSPSGISNSSGEFLAGQGDKAGTNYVRSFGEEILAGPNVSALRRGAQIRIMKAWPHNRAYAAGIVARMRRAEIAALHNGHHGRAEARFHHVRYATANVARPPATSATGTQHAATVDAAIATLSVGTKKHQHHA